jgi:hypothetical protein
MGLGMKLQSPKSKIQQLAVKGMISVHGNIVQPEYPELIEEVSRKGWGATFWGKEDSTNWFHLPFTLASQWDGIRPLLSRLSLYFHNTTRSPITAVHVYDGARLIQAFNGLKLSGDHVRAADKANTFVITKPAEILFGLGVSVQVDFPKAENETKPPRWILFGNASAEFRV